MNTVQGWFAEQGWVRARRGKVILGVCAGIAHRYGLPPWLVRLAFIASCLLPGPQFLIYIALAIAMPVAGDRRTDAHIP